MATRKVKFFDGVKAQGFITPSDGTKDVFVHMSDLQAQGLSSLSENQDVDYSLTEEREKTKATGITILK